MKDAIKSMEENMSPESIERSNAIYKEELLKLDSKQYWFLKGFLRKTVCFFLGHDYTEIGYGNELGCKRCSKETHW